MLTLPHAPLCLPRDPHPSLGTLSLSPQLRSSLPGSPQALNPSFQLLSPTCTLLPALPTHPTVLLAAQDHAVSTVPCGTSLCSSFVALMTGSLGGAAPSSNLLAPVAPATTESAASPETFLLPQLSQALPGLCARGKEGSQPPSSDSCMINK